MENLKKLYEKWEHFATSPFGVVYILNDWLWIVSWVLSWNSVSKCFQIADSLMTSCLIVYGVIKFIAWFAKNIKRLIADEFKYQVRAVVRKELKSLSRV